MKYRVTIEALAEKGVDDPAGRPLTRDFWKTNFYQEWENDKLNEVIAAVAIAVNEAQKK